ncbi:MAG: hypothetical protein KAI80_04630 [Hyphomicrobiaceae bacterium]|nr:hypothetical protein [Hyphomicrobiaceae bacterium]
MLARTLMALGLGGFWLLVGHGFGRPGLGLAAGMIGAAFIFAWTHPGRRHV